MNPISETTEILSTKSIDQYKIIEDRYLTLKRYFRIHFRQNNTITKQEVEKIIESLEDEPIEILTEEEES